LHSNDRKDVLKLYQPWLIIYSSDVKQSSVTAPLLTDSTTAANSSGKVEGPNSHAAISRTFKATSVADWITDRTQVGCIRRVTNSGHQ
jgi:hypothetical protein